MLREKLGRNFLIVTPGIRPSGVEVHEQKRATTPAEAIRAGADYLVVGRPIAQALSPREAASKFVEEIQRAFEGSQT
jgi:orotidine-5'-phosphate decarboxylase